MINIDFDKLQEGGFDEDLLPLPGGMLVDVAIDEEMELDLDCLCPMSESGIGDLLIDFDTEN